jgi:hypothetical protein
MAHRDLISIWFFVGVLLLVYGVLICGAGIYGLSNPPDRTVVLQEVHASIWWGGVMIALGAFYTAKFRPGKGKS